MGGLPVSRTGILPKVPSLKWANGRLQQFRTWLQNEITQTQSDRSALEKKWQDQLVQWRAALPTGEKDFPWPGAANLNFPLTAIHSDPVYADIIQSLHAPEDYWGVTPKRPDRNEHASPMREFLTAVERNFIGMRSVNSRALLDLIIHGTTIYKNHWTHEKRPKLVPNAAGELEKQIRIHSAPRIEHIPLQHFYIPARAWAIDPDEQGGAQWVAQKFYVREPELVQRAKTDGTFLPDYDPDVVMTVRRWLHERDDKVDGKVQELNEFTPFSDEAIELFEVHVRFDVDNDGAEEDVVVVWHQLTGMVLRATLSPMMHGKRPFHKATYLPTFGFYGMGIAEIDEWAQLTLTKLVNATIDNVTLTNTAMFAAPFGSSLRPGEPVYPGRVINYQPGETPPTRLALGDINQSLPQLKQFFLQAAEMRTGVSDLRQGNINGLPGRTPATTIMSMMQEGNKRFDMVLSNLRTVHGEMGLRLSQNVAQFYMDDEPRWTRFCRDALGEADAAKVLEVLRGGVEELESSLGVSVTATSAMVNKEAEKQSFIGLLQIATQIYGQAIQTVQMAEQMPPESMTAQTAAASYSAITELLARLLERFDIQNPSQYLGNMKAIAGSLTGMQNGQNAATMGLVDAMQPAPLSPFPGPAPTIDPTLAPIFGLAA
jgi:hypothetical protein